MADLTHLWRVGQLAYYRVGNKLHKGTVKEVYADHLIVDCPDISDHIWFQQGYNLDCLYPDYNIK